MVWLGGVAASVGPAVPVPGLLLLLWSLWVRRAGESGLEHRTPTEEGLGHGLRSDLHWIRVLPLTQGRRAAPEQE